MYYNKVVVVIKNIPRRDIWVLQEGTNRGQMQGISSPYRNARRSIKAGVVLEFARIQNRMCYVKIGKQELHFRASFVSVKREKRERR